uniref:OTU domain-containing protein n=1 Tax=Anopheles epiroticus TaxID=199890 RepID=A0A182PWZ3_9DIPT
MDTIKSRGFAHGCREMPDMCDRFLENLGYYRKRTAFDASSLFRVVSEHVYDIQIYHEKVRADCVDYMRQHKARFAKRITWSFESYLSKMSRSRTHGTLLELRALALQHRANVLMFEPLAEAKWFVHYHSHEKLWRIYVGHDNHFDSIFRIEYMTDVAECQAIVYNLLYKDVMRLPDVEYAVERMLHDPDDKTIKYETDSEGNQLALTENGQKLMLCKPGSGTECILVNPQLCRFHNGDNFDMTQRFFHVHGSEEGYRMYVGQSRGTKKPNPLLHDEVLSCVRQLVNLNIPPFPYKVAKTLDRNIYRNIEFDVWSEERKNKWAARVLEGLI